MCNKNLIRILGLLLLLVHGGFHAQQTQEVHEPKTSEKRLMWDDENRLRGISDNGFVSHYTYDASGERVLKQSGNGEGVHVNSEWSGGSTSTKGYTLYVSPYMVVKNGAEYSKHVYVGSQRIVSKLGDGTTYQGLDPRKVPKAGDGLDPSVRPNWEEKIRLANGEVQAVYDTLKVPYSGSGNAPPFVICPACKPSNGATSTTPGGSTSGSATGKLANPEKLMYYYHPDHLGSSSYISNLNGEIAQHIEYVPFGEVFLEERNGSYGTPYLFNAKELDEETGLYYYGARYLNPKTSLWLSVDPLAEKYPSWSPYNYALQNPVKFVDPDGLDPTPFYKWLLGHTNYYAWRYRDFVRQNPGVKPPDYYMGYGHKYINRFTYETNKTMSSVGKVWLKEARYNLQVAIEDRLNPQKYSDANTIEFNNDKFRSFAFDSHVDAYWNENGKVPLYTLGSVDLTQVLLTPDAKDLTSEDGLRQVKDMMGKFIFEKPNELMRILKDAFQNRDTIQKLIEDKAKKEGVPVDEIRRALRPILILIPSQQPENKTK